MTLNDFFRDHPAAALAFSGGVDSAYLLHAGLACGAHLRPYFVRSPFQPAFELEDARRLTRQLGTELRVVEADVLALPDVRNNPPDRCYHCKRAIFSAIHAAARADGLSLILDGTNASDDASDRPGMRALRECGLTKAEIRRLSHEAGLFTWDKPAYACLATRIPAGTPITPEALALTESAETALAAMGFSDFRVRTFHGCARIQVRPSQLPLALERRPEILETLGKQYDGVMLDLEVRDEQ